MDSIDQTFEGMTRGFRAQLEAAIAEPPSLPPLEPLGQRIAASIGATLLSLLGLALLGALLTGMAYAARLGWELAG